MILFIYGLFLNESISNYVGLLGTFALVGTFWFNMLNIQFEIKTSMIPHYFTFAKIKVGSNCYMSHLIGFFGVIYFYCMTGFVCFTIWGGFVFGFKSNDIIAHNIILSAIMFVVYVGSILWDFKHRVLSVF